jgi:hypothetical protein
VGGSRIPAFANAVQVGADNQTSSRLPGRGYTMGTEGACWPRQVAPALLGVSHLVVTAVAGLARTVCGMSYSSDLSDEQWALLEPVFNASGKHAPDLQRVVDAMLSVSHTGRQ